MIEPYYTWQTFEATLGGQSVRWAGKPGLEAWDTLRPSTRLLAEEMSSVEPGQRVLDLCCGTGTMHLGLPHTWEVPGAWCMGFATGPGVFSRGELDPGTRALIETMMIQSGEGAILRDRSGRRGDPGDRPTVLDLGCGCRRTRRGIVGAVSAQMGGKVVCVDSSAIALQATRATCELNGVTDRVQVLASDCASAVRDRRFAPGTSTPLGSPRGMGFDLVVTNPQFHQGLGVEHDMAQQFVRDAAHVLNQDGKLYLVANPWEVRTPGKSTHLGSPHTWEVPGAWCMGHGATALFVTSA